MPHGVNGDLTKWSDGAGADSEKCDSLRATVHLTLDRSDTSCGAPFQHFVDSRKYLHHHLARSFWKGFGDIKEAFTPGHFVMEPSKFYLEDDHNTLQEDDNFFEDITQLYKKQAVLFQRSCDQIKDVYRVDIVNSTLKPNVSPFGEVSKIGGEELYCDVLYCLIHMIGCDKENFNQFELVEHLRKSFQIEPQRHLQLYETIESKPPPKVKLNLCFVEAKDLVPKNVSGTSNPYCTFYCSSNKFSPQSTSCKSQTLYPVWNETYTLDVQVRVLDGISCFRTIWLTIIDIQIHGKHYTGSSVAS